MVWERTEGGVMKKQEKLLPVIPFIIAFRVDGEIYIKSNLKQLTDKILIAERAIITNLIGNHMDKCK
jgi:hypothetical protein